MLLRPMTQDDVDGVVVLQREASLVAFAHIFPPDEHPYPTEAITAQWRGELADPAIAHYVVDDGEVRGFVVLRGDELLHLGTALATWGTGLAARAHAEALALIRAQGHDRAWLWVLADNARARRFYERHGWTLTDGRGVAEWPPHPELVRYETDLRAVCVQP